MTTAEKYAGYLKGTNRAKQLIEDAFPILNPGGNTVYEFDDGSRGEFIEKKPILGEADQIFVPLGCVICQQYKTNLMVPSHTGSPKCESGSLASGGHYSHCTCDTCF